ncbi:MAG: DUF6288 domain-containing protein [Planctomycetota bacterium]|nr:DUF6288 domain-containing protein [Planctomycetota bacterium]
MSKQEPRCAIAASRPVRGFCLCAAVAVCVLLLSHAAAYAADDAFNLGPLGAEGLPTTPGDVKEVPALKGLAGLRVTAVHVDGPGEKAGMKRGDIIIGVGRSMLPKKKYPVYALMEIMELVLTTDSARADLIVLRDGKQMILKTQLESLGKHGRNCPIECERCDKLAAASLEYLAKTQQKDGSFTTRFGGTNGSVVVTCICGLAFLASGSTPLSGPYADSIVRCKEYIVANCGKELFPDLMKGANWSQVNWPLGYTACFLAEYNAHDPTPELLAKLEELATSIERNQEASGGWAHGPGGPNALGYTDFAKVSQWCLAGLGACKKSGVTVSETVIAKGIEYFLQCSSGDGGVGYSPQPGQKGMGDPGRTGGAVFAFAMCDQKNHAFFKKMAGYFKTNMGDIPDGHVSPVMHFMSSALACSHLDQSCWTKLFETFRFEFVAARRLDGSFSARPTQESTALHSNNDRSMGYAWTTGSYLVTLLLQKGHLRLLAGKPSTGGKR